MAANSKSARGIASIGKRVINQIWTENPRVPAQCSARSAFILTLRRAAHSSAYEKNLDDQVRPSVVPDDIIQPQSDKYWAPHPQTGVFGPSAEHNDTAGRLERGLHASSANGSQESVLEEKAWFRPTSIEDMEKPHHH